MKAIVMVISHRVSLFVAMYCLLSCVGGCGPQTKVLREFPGGEVLDVRVAHEQIVAKGVPIITVTTIPQYARCAIAIQVSRAEYRVVEEVDLHRRMQEVMVATPYPYANQEYQQRRALLAPILLPMILIDDAHNRSEALKDALATGQDSNHVSSGFIGSGCRAHVTKTVKPTTGLVEGKHHTRETRLGTKPWAGCPVKVGLADDANSITSTAKTDSDGKMGLDVSTLIRSSRSESMSLRLIAGIDSDVAEEKIPIDEFLVASVKEGREIDGSRGERRGKPRCEVRVTQGQGPYKAGDTIAITIAVANSSDGDIYRLKAAYDSDLKGVNGGIVHIGRVAGGTSTDRTVSIRVDSAEAAGPKAIKFVFEDLHGDAPKSVFFRFWITALDTSNSFE